VIRIFGGLSGELREKLLKTPLGFDWLTNKFADDFHKVENRWQDMVPQID
jgi:hypothetical protein